MDGVEVEPEPRPLQYSVYLPAEQWRDLVLWHQTFPMVPRKYQSIMDSIAVQTSRIRE